jgi:hypothetical protein
LCIETYQWHAGSELTVTQRREERSEPRENVGKYKRRPSHLFGYDACMKGIRYV